ncbi:GerAB/ArcD/ProY family transporter [Clostridium ganghwense]|uniref:Endospore germination permease n=1 Tax=Clostridium ganghwense TaxID=312089 RepID=A0ABT4CPN3_9CLOT|nr:endospore germination permease [Clostridium ganghwense]MCY6371018.1 endospore germination permease [Clostridium ganghwense]
MNKSETEFLTTNQITALLVGFTVGPGLLRSPNVLVKIAKQDAWISSIIGLIYPAYILLVSNYIIKKYPKDNILSLSRRCFGNTLGTLLNFIFICQWTLYAATITSDLIKISRIYFVSFLTPLKVALAIVTITFCAAYTQIKSLGKINEVCMYLLTVIMLFSIASLKYGNILNVQPIFNTSLKDMLRASILSVYYYAGFECLLLIHPFAQNTNEIKKASMQALFISGLIWVWIAFITIYYLGIDIIPKSHWSFILVFESINIPVINNFRYVFMFVWSFIVFRITSNFCFITYFFLNMITKIDIKKILIFLYPLILILSLQFLNTALYQKVLKVISPAFTLFNIIYISFIALSILVKNKNTVLYKS